MHLASRQLYLFDNACCCMYSLELLMMDGKTVRNMYSKNVKQSRYRPGVAQRVPRS